MYLVSRWYLVSKTPVFGSWMLWHSTPLRFCHCEACSPKSNIQRPVEISATTLHIASLVTLLLQSGVCNSWLQGSLDMLGSSGNCSSSASNEDFGSDSEWYAISFGVSIQQY